MLVSARPSFSNFGPAVMTDIRPAEALRPNTVTRGPRNTSTRSTGPSSVRAVPLRERSAPSLKTAPQLSRPGLSPTLLRSGEGRVGKEFVRRGIYRRYPLLQYKQNNTIIFNIK